MNILATIMVVAGLIFLTISCLGILRLPDFYTRNHAAGKAGTLGAVLVLGGLIIYNGWNIASLKIILVLIFFAVGNPTATHAIARAAYKLGLEMWTAKTRGDDLSGRIDYLEPEDHLTEDKR